MRSVQRQQLPPLAAMTTSAMRDINLLELEEMWGLSRNAVKNRAKALGIKLRRPSHNETTWPAEFLEAGQDLDRWIKDGNALSDHPAVSKVPALTAAPSAAPLAAVKPQASDLVVLLEAVSDISKSPAITDPLATAQGLAAAADNELALTSKEMADLLGRRSLSPSDDGSSPRPGFIIHRIQHRTKKANKGLSNFWTVARIA